MKDRLIQCLLGALGAVLLLMASMIGWFILDMHATQKVDGARLDRIESNQRALAAGLEISLGGDPTEGP
jgi:hypothetical protein